MKTVLTIFVTVRKQHHLKVVWPGSECHITLEYRAKDGVLVMEVEHANDVEVDSHVPSL